MEMFFFYVFNSFTLFFLSPECGIAQLSLPLFVSLSWSTSIASIICMFVLVHLNNCLFNELVDDVVKEVNVKEALNSSILVVQKAAAPKNDDTVAVRPQA